MFFVAQENFAHPSPCNYILPYFLLEGLQFSFYPKTKLKSISNFCIRCEERVEIHGFCINVQFLKYHLKMIFSPLYCLCQKTFDFTCMIPFLDYFSHLFIYLCQSYTLLITIVLQKVLKSCSVSPSKVFFFKIALTVLGPLHFYTKFTISSPTHFIF